MASVAPPPSSRPIAHLGFEGARHLVPDRLPSARREQTVGIRVLDLTQETVDNIQRVSGSLRRLELSGLDLDEIPEDVTRDLTRLERLDVNFNSLTENSFPDNIRDLDKLIEFSAHENKLTQVPKVLQKLKGLHRLKLSQNSLVKIDGLERLRRLQTLVLDGNKLGLLTKEFFTNLKRLEILHCADNCLTGIPGEIRCLRNLRDLNLADNNLSYIPPEVFRLPKLEVLNVSCNQITRIPTMNLKGQQKPKLASLDLSDNQLSRFPSHLLFMTDKLDLCRNNIRTISLSLVDKLEQVPDLQILLDDNNMTLPPQDVCDCGLRSIIQYFMEAKTDMKIYQGLKVLVLGAADQGKTSLVQTMVDQQSRLTDGERTVGMDMYEYFIDRDGGNPLGQHLNLSFFDFSGNPRYLYQHQFFMQQPALVLLVFNLAEFDEATFKATIGCWIDWVIARDNRIVALPVGTHADKIPPRKLDDICQRVLARINQYVTDIKASIQREIKRIESRPYISPALSEQLQLYINLTKLEAVIFDKVIPVSAKKYTGFSDLEQAIVTMSEDKEIFPNVLRLIPSLWGDVENFVDDRGYSMDIPMMEWDDYQALIVSKFGMRHLIQGITVYLHDIGKVVWFHKHPTLQRYVFLRPSWLADVFKAIFRHDVADIDYTIEESFRQNGISSNKLERMKKEILESGTVDRDFIKCAWSAYFKTDLNKPLLEVLGVLMEYFHLGYPVNSRGIARKTSTVSEKTDKIRSDSASTTRSSVVMETKPESRAGTAASVASSSINTKSKTADVSDQPKITKLFVPFLRQNQQPLGFKEEYQRFSSHPSITAVFRFPKYIYPGLFESFTVLAQNNEFELEPLFHWKNGMYARHMQNKLRFFLQRIDHDDGGTCLRTELRPEEKLEEKDIDQLWRVLLPFIQLAEESMAKFAVEEFLQKLLQEASRRRQEAAEREKAEEAAKSAEATEASSMTEIPQDEETPPPDQLRAERRKTNDSGSREGGKLTRRRSNHDDKKARASSARSDKSTSSKGDKSLTTLKEES